MPWFSKFLGPKKSEKPIPTPQPIGPINYDVSMYDQADVSEFTALLCDGYLLSGSFTLNEIANFVRNTYKKHSDHILLATLDDTDQGFYTCGHSINSNDLDNTYGYDLSGLPRELFKDGKHCGYLKSKEEFSIRKGNFRKNLTGLSVESLLKKRWWSGDTDSVPSLLSPKSKSTLPRENRSYVQIVDVENCYEAIAAFPNGYFSDDYDPFENYTLAMHLYETFGFKLFGIGAVYLGFMREDALNDKANQKLAKFISGLYDNYEGEVLHQDLIADLLSKQTVFYIAYADR